MELDLKPLIRPTRLVPDKLTLSDTFGRFTLEPLDRGYGTTLGNALRRVLLSSIQGAAATSVRFEGVRHEFTAVPGAREDVNDVILNLKQVIFRLNGSATDATITLKKKGPARVTAGDFQLPDEVSVLNPDQHIAEITDGAVLDMDVMVSAGRGYMPAQYPEMEDEDDIGILPIDAVFSPIRKVRYEVSDARVGQRTDYDRLVFEVTTNGTVRPEEAISYAAKIIRDHLDILIRVEDREAGLGEAALLGLEGDAEGVAPIQAILDKSIEELELSVRSFNCLEAAGIKTIRDLVQKTESEMLKYRNFGRKSLSEIKAILKQHSLSFNMKLDERGLPVNMATDDRD
jgi:DNA-directed RNA polymerase subunit alpha